MTTATPERDHITAQECVIRLAAREAQAFLAAWDAPSPPNAALKAAFDDYAARRDDQTGSLDWAPRPKRV